MKRSDFRKEIIKVMPGYSWTVHKSNCPDTYLLATGIQSSGLNRMSTLSVEKRNREGTITYEVKSAGFGKKSPWVFTNSDSTLAKALRGLQDNYKALARKYMVLEAALLNGRVSKSSESVAPQHEPIKTDEKDFLG